MSVSRGLIVCTRTALPFQDLFDQHGGSDRDIDAYPAASPRYQYVSAGESSGILVRAATNDIIHNTAGSPDNLHFIVLGSEIPGPGGAQYCEVEAEADGGSGICENYTRLTDADTGYGLFASLSSLQFFHWGSGANGLFSGGVSLSDGQFFRMWQFTRDEDPENQAAGVRCQAGVLGLGRLINDVHNSGPFTRWFSGRPGAGFFRPTGAPALRIRRIVVSNAIPAYVDI